MEDFSGSIPSIEECEEILKNSGMDEGYFTMLNGNKNNEKVDVL